MRLLLTWLDQLKRTTVEGLPAFCAALVSTLEGIQAATNTWAGSDHNPAGTHEVVKYSVTTTAPSALVGHLVTWWDGTNLKWKKPDGTTGNIV